MYSKELTDFYLQCNGFLHNLLFKQTFDMDAYGQIRDNFESLKVATSETQMKHAILDTFNSNVDAILKAVDLLTRLYSIIY